MAAADQVEECLVITDPKGRILFANRIFARLAGLPGEKVSGKSLTALDLGCDGDFMEALAESMAASRAHKDQTVLRREGEPDLHLAVTLSPVGKDGGPATHFIVTGRDVTRRVLVEAQLRASEERYALAAQGANDGLWDWDMRADRVYLSPRWKAMVGRAEEDLGEDLDSWFGCVHPEDVEEFKVKLYAHIEGLSAHFEHEHRMDTPGGETRWVLTRGLTVRDEAGRAYRMAGSMTDITVRKLAEQQLVHDAFHDALTGLPNRALFIDRLEQSMARAQRKDDHRFAVLFLDLDRFKLVNDSLSHTIGDRLLIQAAERLQASLRPADTVARMGGDEFAILIEEVRDARDAAAFADRIERSLKEPFLVEGSEIFTSASIGIALGSPSYERAADILRDADTAMYRAKSLGRARFALFEKAMHEGAVATLQMETDLRRALERKELRVYYQPLVSLKTGRTAGFEALLRWVHPKRGIVMPSDFITLAEETGLIIPIGQWVLGESCRQLRLWRSRFPKVNLMVSANLSGVQFLRPELIAQIDLLLRECGLSGADLKIEITESTLIENAEYAKDMLRQIKALDIRLCVDDFGTGYSSMSYLRRYPIDTVKIDKSFISRMDQDPESLEIVKTIVTMAHNLGKDIIAEGVETREQLAQIKALKCEYAQGFFFSKAVDRDAAESLVDWRWYW